VRLLLVVNVAASGVSARTCGLVEQELSAHHDVTVVKTTARWHACSLAKEGSDDGADAVVVFGGDGAVNEAANGLVGTSTALAALPGGSTNVFARTVGLANRPEKAVHQVVAALEARSVRRVGMGRAGDRWFLFHLGIGYDAAVVAQVEQRGGLKRWLGHGLFAVAAVNTWVRGYDRSRPRFSVRLPDGSTIDDGYFAICSKTDPYTFLGPQPFRVNPDVGFDTPLGLVVLRDLSASTLLGAAAAALRGGTDLGGRACVEQRSGLEQLTVTGNGPFPYQVDGDFLGETESLEITHRASCLDVVVPVPEEPTGDG
jgi:diacylglycerol kinase family enzyme